MSGVDLLKNKNSVLTHLFNRLRLVFIPIGLRFDIRNVKVAPPARNVMLERYYKNHTRLTTCEVDELAKKLETSPQTIEKWWKRRRAQNQPTTLDKFCETCWKSSCQAAGFICGIWNCYNEPYFWEFKLCFEDFKNHVSG